MSGLFQLVTNALMFTQTCDYCKYIRIVYIRKNLCFWEGVMVSDSFKIRKRREVDIFRGQFCFMYENPLPCLFLSHPWICGVHIIATSNFFSYFSFKRGRPLWEEDISVESWWFINDILYASVLAPTNIGSCLLTSYGEPLIFVFLMLKLVKSAIPLLIYWPFI